MSTWIIGAGLIAREYAKILNSLGEEYTAIGRGEESASQFEIVTSHPIIRGGINKHLATSPEIPDNAIVAVRTPDLVNVTLSLIKFGIKNILIEKPGFRTPEEIDAILDCIKASQASVFIAYNRRFYSSTLKAEKIIKEDGGVKSFHFEFTEWPAIVEKAGYDSDILNYWFYGNSTHVLDLAFFLGGTPSTLTTYISDQISWHKPAIFAGAGITDNGALFSYQANWKAPGRWSVEILTDKHRLYFKPMEILQIQEMNSVAVNPVYIDDRLDKEFKPGFYLETKAFIEKDYSRLCSVSEQKEHVDRIYRKILGEI